MLIFIPSGGVRVPCIIRYPGMKDKEISNEFCTVMDLVPTMLEMAGVGHPAPTYNGRDIVPMRGTSMKAWLEVSCRFSFSKRIQLLKIAIRDKPKRSTRRISFKVGSSVDDARFEKAI